MSVLLPLPKPEEEQGAEREREREGVVEWKPPHIDWNPWTNRSAYLEGAPYAQLEPVSPCLYWVLCLLYEWGAPVIMSNSIYPYLLYEWGAPVIMSNSAHCVQAERAARLSQELAHEMSRRKGNEIALQKVSIDVCVSITVVDSSFSLPPPPPLSLSQSLQDRQALPISSQADTIISRLQSHQVVIIRGSTGCGKTTQVPQYLLDHMIASGNGAHCNIVVTQVNLLLLFTTFPTVYFWSLSYQPRRISAVSVAERVAQERCEDLGLSTGYSVRFESALPRHYGSILFCTVGESISLSLSSPSLSLSSPSLSPLPLSLLSVSLSSPPLIISLSFSLLPRSRCSVA